MWTLLVDFILNLFYRSKKIPAVIVIVLAIVIIGYVIITIIANSDRGFF
ncbi:MAG: hypothetical protein ACOYXT_10165 [Bacteroidota bacterium]